MDCLTSSDDDDYISAFKPKVSMKPPAKQPGKGKQHTVPEGSTCRDMEEPHLDGQGSITYIAKGKVSAKTTETTVGSEYHETDEHEESLPASDAHGNPVTGHFCQFSLAAKFPCKYMNDSNDRVSRHFFAANKFYERTWDL